ncbi:TauD/TfdA family dioxygenase [Candidatus Gracilibacteria bacterium]|nr:TauD/TfdA family dioxygenase [Candidatus Gracilibacteria bacterium]NJM87986.1 TauD/TfdA family dioxygenase [Hydrococcus sp. RU_2_2]NJP21369.1 TauD/TfdA family dioxygenase [Hydrococcus sp. CRU_1_1]
MIEQKLNISNVQKPSRLGVEVLPGCNLAQITAQQVQELKQSLWKYGVVAVREQNLTASQLLEFAKKTFGNSIAGIGYDAYDPEIDSDLQSPGVFILGNPKGATDEIGERGSWEWHQDKDCLPRTPGLDMNALYVVMLYGIEIPQGIDGQPHTTEFLDLIEAYNNLDGERQKQLEPISLYHLAPGHSKMGKDVPMKIHPVVSTHKVTGKKGLYLASSSAIPIGMENCLEKAKEFWIELLKEVLRNTPTYYHTWKKGDIVFWENSQVMHRGTAYDAIKSTRIALRLGVVDS